MRRRKTQNQSIPFVLIGLIVLGLYFYSYKPDTQSIVGTSLFDFTVMQDTLSQEFTAFNKHTAILGYPGSVMRLEPTSISNYRAGIGRLQITAVDSSGARITLTDPFRVACSNMDKYSWSPAGVHWQCSDSLSKRNISMYPYNEYIYIIEISSTCNGGTACNLDITNNGFTAVTSPKGYKGQVINVKIGDGTTKLYALGKQAPTTNVDGKMTYTGSFKTHFVFALGADLAKAETILSSTTPQTYIVSGTNELSTWYGAFEPPTLCENQWCTQRYWRSISSTLYNTMKPYPNITSKWVNHYAITPGSNYHGVWIWDSFFAAWSGVNTCKDSSCADYFFDSLRVLVANKQSSGLLPRAVWYSKVESGWQAPGGWSFAANQADKRFNSNKYSTEFYPHLKQYHEWIVANQDDDKDNIFEWGGTNSGWDGSLRWEVFSSPNNGIEMEALDLQAWMIIDAENLRDMATRLGYISEAEQWEQKRVKYIQGFQSFCRTGICYDQHKNNSLSPIITPAMYFGMFAGAVTPTQANKMIEEMYNPMTLGAIQSDGQGVLPTVSRSQPGFDPCAYYDTWSGAEWINVNGITYLGLLRYGKTTDAEYLRKSTKATIELSGFGYESYCSGGAQKTVGDIPNNFGGRVYTWTDSFNLILSRPIKFDLGPVNFGNVTPPPPPPPPCTPSWGCTGWSVCANDIQTRTCTDSNNCGVDTNKPSTSQYCGSVCVPSDELCDNKDNNCDGLIDNGVKRTCTTNDAYGIQVCHNGIWASCNQTVLFNHSCTTTGCQPDIHGTLTLSACTAECNPGNQQNITYYGCNDANQCVVDSNGKYITSDCNTSCTPEKKDYTGLYVILGIGIALYVLRRKKRR